MAKFISNSDKLFATQTVSNGVLVNTEAQKMNRQQWPRHLLDEKANAFDENASRKKKKTCLKKILTR